MEFTPAPLDDVFVITPRKLSDARGFFMETYRTDVFKRETGLDIAFVQDNHSASAANVVRGLHFQWEPPMAKLMRVTAGRAFLVAVDIRKDSPKLGEWFGIEVSADDGRQVWAPAGFARGFCALADKTEIQYKCTGTYNQAAEAGILWNDPAIGIKWPVEFPGLSEKDSKAPTLADWLARPESEHFRL